MINKDKDNKASRKVITDLARGIKDVFKNYSKYNRQRGWDTIKSKEGETQVKKLIVDPNYPLSGFERMNFKEFIDHQKSL